MSRLTDYLLMRKSAMSDNYVLHESGSDEQDTKLSNRRLGLSLVGILLGIFLSFVITGLQKVTADQGGATQTENVSNPSTSDSDGLKVNWPSRDKLLAMLLVSGVICLLSYQGLYAALRAHRNEPAFLILCLSFQYGFFWQSVVKGFSVILS